MSVAKEIRVRPYEPADVQSLFEAARESTLTVSPWLPWCHAEYTLEDARSWIQEVNERDDLHELAILSGDERFLGGCGLNAIRRKTQTANLGYWVRTSERGQGIAPEAVTQLVCWAQETTPLHRIEVLVATGNAASIRVMEKTDAVEEGIWPGRLTIHGVRHDAVVYSFTLR